MLEIKISPFSINKAWVGRRFMTKEYKQWRKDFSILCKKGKHDVFDILGLDFYVKSYAMADLSNFLKTTEDALVECGITADDRYTKAIFIRKFKVESKSKEKIIVRFIKSS